MITEHDIERLQSDDMTQDAFALAKEYSELVTRFRTATDEAEDVKRRMLALEPVLLERMQEQGVQNLNIGGNNLHIKETFYVSKRAGTPTERVIDQLRRHGLGYLVSEGYNAASLKGKLREYIDDGVPIPDELMALLNVGIAKSVGYRRS